VTVDATQALSPHSVKTLADGYAQGKDNFLLLRFIAAALVIYGHAPAISGDAAQDIFLRANFGEYSGEIAVDVFFAISGFLVTASYLRRQHLADFILARIVRIVPAYAVCLLLCALVIGPLFSTLMPAVYFAQAQVYVYVAKNLSFSPYLVWTLPGVFASNPIAIVNGSIWTLPVEAGMYLCVALFGAFGILARRAWLCVVLAAMIILAAAYLIYLPITNLPAYLRMAGLFALGGLCFVYRSRIPLHGAMVIAITALAWLGRTTPAYAYLFALGETAFVFWFAYNLDWPQVVLTRFKRLGDYSYGLYLWGYPAQQIVTAVFGPLPALLNALYGFLIALALAIASWHWIEQPALAYKPRRAAD
jgi:peptidoglycan/LPS O-acetylase OafA/YrhL